MAQEDVPKKKIFDTEPTKKGRAIAVVMVLAALTLLVWWGVSCIQDISTQSDSGRDAPLSSEECRRAERRLDAALDAAERAEIADLGVARDRIERAMRAHDVACSG